MDFVSDSLYEAGEQQMTIVVRAFPPKLSCNNHVKMESLNGTCILFSDIFGKLIFSLLFNVLPILLSNLVSNLLLNLVPILLSTLLFNVLYCYKQSSKGKKFNNKSGKKQFILFDCKHFLKFKQIKYVFLTCSKWSICHMRIKVNTFTNLK